MTLCSCGLYMEIRKKAFVCRHCDGTEPHVAARCDQCRRMMPPKPAKP